MKSLSKTAIAIISSLFFLSVFLSCNKATTEPKGDAAIYLLESFDTLDASFRIDEAGVVTKPEPFIEYSDLLYYDKKNHTFKLSKSAADLLGKSQFGVYGEGFALKANDEILYTGYFWPAFSSVSCDWIVIDPIIISDRKMKVNIGYPNSSFATGVEDKRNNKTLLDIFKRDGKLID